MTFTREVYSPKLDEAKRVQYGYSLTGATQAQTERD